MVAVLDSIFSSPPTLALTNSNKPLRYKSTLRVLVRDRANSSIFITSCSHFHRAADQPRIRLPRRLTHRVLFCLLATLLC
jgi:hypothetical protein